MVGGWQVFHPPVHSGCRSAPQPVGVLAVEASKLMVGEPQPLGRPPLVVPGLGERLPHEFDLQPGDRLRERRPGGSAELGSCLRPTSSRLLPPTLPAACSAGCLPLSIL